MLRLRRYRVFLVFAVIAVLTLYKFGGSSTSWRYDGTESTESTGAEKEDVPQSPHWEPRPQVAQETKKLEIDISIATSLAPQSPPAVPPASRPVDDAAPASPFSKKPPTRPTPVIGDDEVDLTEQGKGRVEVSALPSTIPPVYWQKLSEHFPVPSKSLVKLPTDAPKSIPKIQATFKPESAQAKIDRESRLNKIRDVAKHSWEGYRNNAWLQDELSPVSGKFRNPFASWGATLVDSLDTLWIMGLKEEFEEAVKAVEEIDFTTSPRADIPLFETTIRYLGGLVAAYDISDKKYSKLLEKAVELAEILISAFDTPNRMPDTYYYWRPSFASQSHRASNRVVLAEIGSLSVEFTRLAQLTGEHKYYDAIARITDELATFQNNTRLPGMWPTYLDASGCNRIDWSSHVEDPLQAPLAGLSESPEGSLKHVPIPNQVEEFPRAGIIDESPTAEPEIINGKKYYPVNQPTLVFVAGDASATDASPKETKAAPIVKRQLNDHMVPNNDIGVTPTTPEPQTSSSSSASPSATLPECEDQGFTSSSSYGGEDFTLGGMSDSTYEYLPKQYLLLGGVVEKYRTMYEYSMDTVKKFLIFRPMLPNGEDILFSGALSVPATPEEGGLKGTFEGENAHLTCFAGGMLGMGAKIFDRPEDLEIAKKLTEGCVWSYKVTSTGIMPEAFITIPCDSNKNCEWNQTKYWLELDPAAEMRKTSYEQQMVNYKEQMASASAWYEEQLAAMTALPSMTETLLSEAAPTAVADLQKRQLDVDPDTVPAAQVPARYQGEPEEAEGPPTRVQMEDGSELPSPAVPSFPAVYSPRPPLTHEEYVKNRIQEERLPPGVTRIKSRSYILRPEAIESVWYMYRITGDPYWREAGWQMFEAVNMHTATAHGNSAIDDVTKSSPELSDEMESFWLAETLKYFYLLFTDESVISLDEWVLNTEAHPFRRPE
ncbi:seven-hairpin glycosidase [Polyplosphaeria fusca]|uniref:alpha-1,2-Mannosidase n=1 Tax=Polyplosphaeria fusca TaxID=682080 RepID=A0A9P4V698_9PLEO|nr:seven-hairpin glycosidase [Polyplosphaeria fusca]